MCCLYSVWVETHYKQNNFFAFNWSDDPPFPSIAKPAPPQVLEDTPNQVSDDPLFPSEGKLTPPQVLEDTPDQVYLYHNLYI